MSTAWKNRLAVLLCWVVGAVFVAAAVSKILHPADFAVAIYRYQLAPHAAINALAVFMPWLEMVCALALFFRPPLRRGALLLILLLLVLFTTAISINLYRGIDIACGCFSVNAARGHLGWLSLLRNAALIAATAWALRWTGRTETAAL